jgi:hypothetical protein
VQQWYDEQPLTWAQQLAEKRARLLKDSSKRLLADQNAPWRKQPLDPASKQAVLLSKYRIPVTAGMTKGEASDLLAAKFAQIERRKQRVS